MTAWRGFSDKLQTPLDLLAKMEHDYRRILASPGDAYPVFDFFVAAESMADWRYPTDKAKRDAIRPHDPGKTVSHLASGAKHFEATATRHASVAGVESEPDYGTAAPDRGRWGEAVWGSAGSAMMVVTVADGKRVSAPELAALVLAYWGTELGPGRMHEVPDDAP